MTANVYYHILKFRVVSPYKQLGTPSLCSSAWNFYPNSNIIVLKSAPIFANVAIALFAPKCTKSQEHPYITILHCTFLKNDTIPLWHLSSYFHYNKKMTYNFPMEFSFSEILHELC